MTYKVPKSVKVAAKLLDKVMPGWYKKISLSRLNMSWYLDCILGQLYGEYDKGIKKLFGVSCTEVSTDTLKVFFGKVYENQWISEINERLNLDRLTRSIEVVKPKQPALVVPSAYTVHIPQIGAASIKKEDVPELLRVLRAITKELESV